MFIVIKSEHYDCTNLICKKDTLEEAVAAVKDSMAQRLLPERNKADACENRRVCHSAHLYL